MKKIIKYTALFILGGWCFTSCSKKFDEINTNPASYNQKNFDPNFLLTSAQVSYRGSTSESWNTNLIYCSPIVQGFSSLIFNWVGDKYELTTSFIGAYWNRGYSAHLKPIADILESTKNKQDYKNLHEIARIMRALIIERITDLYGDVPYSEAGLGYYEKKYFPKYDKQQDIYNDMLKEVSEAVANLNSGADKVTGDLIYKGDIDKWKRFGNSLILRMAMRLTKADPATAKTWVQKVSGNTMSSNSDNAFINGDATGGTATVNPNSWVLLGNGGPEAYYVKWSSTFINFLKANNDPRLEKVSVTQLYLNLTSTVQNPLFNTDPSVQKGMPNGKDLSGIPGRDISTDPSYTTIPDYSSPNPGMLKLNGPIFILTYGESELLLAEAAQTFGIGGDATEHYNNGVKAAITYLDQYDPSMAITDATAESYLAAHPYDAGNGLAMINTQYWVLTNTMFDFYESWSNWRRSGYPVLVPIVHPSSVTNGIIPRRFPYPLDEANLNPTNYKPASAAVPGGDDLTGRVWWDKQ